MARKRGVVASLMGARRRAGIGLIAGAVVVWLGGEQWGLHWVPLLAGLTYLVAASRAGAKDGPWGAGCVLTGWGLALVAVHEGWIDEPEAPMAVLGIGAGLVAAALLRERGTEIALGGTATAVVLGGLAYLFYDDVEALARPATYALVIAAWGVVNLLELRVGRR